jgi:hypothetical protein
MQRHGTLLALSLFLLPALAAPGRAQSAAGWLARETAADYRAQARYPRSARVLKAGDPDPIRAKRTPSRQSMPGPEGKGPVLSVWASAVSVEPGQPVDLFAELADQGKRFPVDVLTGEVVDGAGNRIASFVYRDDGLTPDAKAGDGIYAARLTDLPAAPAGQAETYRVQARAVFGAQETRDAVGGFLASNPGARLTGEYRESLRDGNLVITAEILVTQPGRFHLAGTLATPKGEPIGTAQAAAVLPAGRQWIELSFYGLMFHDRQVAGPYQLATLALTAANGMPNAFAGLVENAYRTRAYRLEEMRSQAFADPRLLDAAQRLESAARAAEAAPQ